MALAVSFIHASPGTRIVNTQLEEDYINLSSVSETDTCSKILRTAVRATDNDCYSAGRPRCAVFVCRQLRLAVNVHGGPPRLSDSTKYG